MYNMDSHKRCPRCGFLKNIEEFRYSKRTGKVKGYCPPCTTDYNRELKQNRREKALSLLGYKCDKCNNNKNLRIVPRIQAATIVKAPKRVSAVIQHGDSADIYFKLLCPECVSKLSLDQS